MLINYEEYKCLNKIDYNKPIVDLKETSRYARKKLFEITKKDGYWDISKNIYEKHGSRRTNFRKRSNSKKIKISPNKLKQFELNLKI